MHIGNSLSNQYPDELPSIACGGACSVGLAPSSRFRQKHLQPPQDLHSHSLKERVQSLQQNHFKPHLPQHRQIFCNSSFSNFRPPQPQHHCTTYVPTNYPKRAISAKEKISIAPFGVIWREQTNNKAQALIGAMGWPRWWLNMGRAPWAQ